MIAFECRFDSNTQGLPNSFPFFYWWVGRFLFSCFIFLFLCFIFLLFAVDPNFIEFISIYLRWFQFSVPCVDDFLSPNCHRAKSLTHFGFFFSLSFLHFFFFFVCQFAQGQECAGVRPAFPFPVGHLLVFPDHITQLNFNPFPRLMSIFAVNKTLNNCRHQSRRLERKQRAVQKSEEIQGKIS